MQHLPVPLVAHIHLKVRFLRALVHLGVSTISIWSGQAMIRQMKGGTRLEVERMAKLIMSLNQLYLPTLK